MKQVFIIILLFTSNIIFAQTIKTDVCTAIENNNITEITYRVDEFKLTDFVLQWVDYQTGYSCYYDIQYKTYYNNKWYIHCMTKGKKILFVISFIEEVVYCNGLFFHKTIKT